MGSFPLRRPERRCEPITLFGAVVVPLSLLYIAKASIQVWGEREEFEIMSVN
jgi:hypothetical protein